METPGISIIIPAHNAAGTITTTIKSILRQNYDNVEVIVIDDGSSDSTYEIIKSFRHIKVIKHTQCQGEENARLSGLKHSTGDYIWFVDADDIIPKDALKTLMQEINKKNCDILNFNTFWKFPFIKKNIRYTAIESSFDTRFNYNGRSVIESIFPYIISKKKLLPNVWDKIYSRQLLTRSNPKAFNRIIGGDWLFNLQVLPYARSMAFTDTYGYCWRFTGGDRKYLIDRWNDLRSLYGIIDNLFHTLPIDPDYIRTYRNALGEARINDLRKSVAERIILKAKKNELQAFIDTEISDPEFSRHAKFILEPDEFCRAAIEGDYDKIIFLSHKHIRNHKLFYNFMRVMNQLLRLRNHPT